MICLKHRTASGSLYESWDYNPHTRILHFEVMRGARTVSVDVLVCSFVRRVALGRPITRADGEAWCLSPMQFSGALVERPSVLDAAIGWEHVLLTHAPEWVSLALEAL